MTSSEPLAGPKAVFPVDGPIPEEHKSLLRFRAASAWSGLSEGAHAMELALRAQCSGTRDGYLDDYSVLVARGSFQLQVTTGALARFRKTVGPFLPSMLHAELVPVVTELLSPSKIGFTPLAMTMPSYWRVKGVSYRAPLRRATDVLAVRRCAGAGCKLIVGFVEQSADVANSTRWVVSSTHVGLPSPGRDDVLEEVPCDIAIDGADAPEPRPSR